LTDCAWVWGNFDPVVDLVGEASLEVFADRVVGTFLLVLPMLLRVAEVVAALAESTSL
jgi:hypothetical protein